LINTRRSDCRSRLDVRCCCLSVSDVVGSTKVLEATEGASDSRTRCHFIQIATFDIGVERRGTPWKRCHRRPTEARCLLSRLKVVKPSSRQLAERDGVSHYFAVSFPRSAQNGWCGSAEEQQEKSIVASVHGKIQAESNR
jgi:hypothetical protein